MLDLCEHVLALDEVIGQLHRFEKRGSRLVEPLQTAIAVASGADDPFHPGIVTFVNAAPDTIDVHFEKDCRTDPSLLA